MRYAILLLLLTGLSLSILAWPEDEAKNTDTKRWKTGFVVTTHGDTIHGKIKTTDFLDVYYDYQRELSFKSDKGKSAEYFPDDLSSFSYEEQNSYVTLQSVSSPEGDGRVFLKLYYSGICKVYGMMINEIKGKGQDIGQNEGPVHSSLIPTERKYLQIGGSQFYPLRRWGFKKNMKEIFATCPRILNGLESNMYTYDNWQTLVKDYNSARNDATSSIR